MKLWMLHTPLHQDYYLQHLKRNNYIKPNTALSALIVCCEMYTLVLSRFRFQMTQKLKEILGPQDGILSYEDKLAPVFCKPKLIPLKSVTIEKLEKMQQDASEKAEYAKNHENVSDIVIDKDSP